MIKIAIVDDHQIVRQGLLKILDSVDDFKVVMQAENGKDFLEKLNAFEVYPDVVILDLQMPELDGFETCTILKYKYPTIRVLILSQIGTKESIKRIVQTGANGYLSKNTDNKTLISAIRKVFEEDYYFDMKLSDVIREAILYKQEDFLKIEQKEQVEILLSKREIEIIELISREYNTGEIADILCLNYRTIESHRRRIMDKIGAKNFIGVVIFAIKNNLINLELFS